MRGKGQVGKIGSMGYREREGVGGRRVGGRRVGGRRVGAERWGPKVGAKISRFFFPSPDPLFVFFFPISVVFRGIAVVLCAFPSMKISLEHTNLESREHWATQEDDGTSDGVIG